MDLTEAYCLGCATRLPDAASECSHCGLSLAGPGSDFEAERAAEDARATPVAWPPRMADGIVVEGGYRIERFLARGGMGEVYEGIDTRLHRKVAIKFLADEYRADRVLVQRFLREARAVASLDHPNIVAVHAVGDHDGRPLMVMKFVDGETVGDLVRSRGRFSVGEAAGIAMQVCEGLAHIHMRGFIHRDIKPQNLMVDREGRALILDFGILRGLSSSATATGMVFGTPAYMPPEQAKDAKLVDARSDLYALGVTLFEMLAGRLPFRATSGLELLMKHQLERAPAVSAHVEGVPKALEDVVHRALEKEPRNRFENALAMRDAIRGAVTGTTPSVPVLLGSKGSGAAVPAPVVAPKSGRPERPAGSTTAMFGESLRPPTSPPHFRGRRPMAFVVLGLSAVVIAAVTVYALREPSSNAPPIARGVAAATPPSPAPSPAASPSAPAAMLIAPATPPVAPPPAAAPPAAASGSGAATASETDEVEAPTRRRARRTRPSARSDAPSRASPVLAAPKEPVPEPAPSPPADDPPKIEPAPVVAAVAVAEKGTLRIVTMQDGKGHWANITIDGNTVGNRTHVFSEKYEPGTYMVSAYRDGFVAKARRVVVSAGKTARVRLELEKRP